MSLSFRMESEFGERLSDPEIDEGHYFAHLLEGTYADHSYQCLRFIDLYGNTVFNGLQMEQLISELHRIRPSSPTEGEKKVLERIEEFARRCQQRPHHYLKFVGD